MIDKILVAISMAALLAFMGVVLVFVAEPDLIIVTLMMIALALHDFWISVFRPREVSAEEHLPLEVLPTGVSGKPLPPEEKPSRKSPRRKSSSKRKK